MQSGILQAQAKEGPELDHMFAVIDGVDLCKIKQRLMMATPRGRGWKEEDADVVTEWYRRFLKLRAKYPGQTLVPSILVDEFWHQHILDTVAYDKDCREIFGQYLHHDPYFGQTEKGRAELVSFFEATNMLYRKEFGVDYMSDEALAGLREAAPSCTTDCR